MSSSPSVASVAPAMVPGEVVRDGEDLVVVKKQLCVIGHSYVRRLRDFIDAYLTYDRTFGLNTIQSEWLGISGMGIASLRETGRTFVLDYYPDIILLQAIGNDLDSFMTIDSVVDAHMDFASELSSNMGGIKVIICSPLHRKTPRYLSMDAYNYSVDECNRMLREKLIDPAFSGSKHLDMRAFKVPNVYFWEHLKMKGITQLIGDGIHLIPVGNTRRYYSCRTIVRELAHQ